MTFVLLSAPECGVPRSSREMGRSSHSQLEVIYFLFIGSNTGHVDRGHELKESWLWH